MNENREFDIVLWGATGFVGRRVAHHLASRESARTLRWAIAGRNEAALQALRAELGPKATALPIMIGNSHDVASLEALANSTKVVCSTVGPYAKYGSELVEACAKKGTHYCDIAGEVHWIRNMIDRHQAEAERSGARIVHACGFDSIPSDLGVFFLQREAKRRYGKPCGHIKLRVKAMKGGLNGGTAATFLYAAEQGRRDPSVRRVMTEPYSLNPEGQREGPDRAQSVRSVAVSYDADLHGWTMPFFMGPINTRMVRRSNALLGYAYGKDFSYEEAIITGDGSRGWMKAKAGAVGNGGLMQALSWRPSRWLMKKVLPRPGEGPSKATRERGGFELALVGKLPDGKVIRARIKGVGDPNTESTSRLVTESALCLAEDAEDIAVGGGFWTPASAMGELLLSRLVSGRDLSFEIVEDIRASPQPDERVQARP